VRTKLVLQRLDLALRLDELKLWRQRVDVDGCATSITHGSKRERTFVVEPITTVGSRKVRAPAPFFPFPFPFFCPLPFPLPFFAPPRNRSTRWSVDSFWML
jgi:hypothetical protein